MQKIREKFETTNRSRFSLTEDFTFKAVFGRDTEESKQALINLLNVMLHDIPEYPIRSVEIKNPYIPGMIYQSKDSILDILAETESGVLVNVEMQVRHFKAYPDRNLFYGGKVVATNALNNGYDYDKMKKTISITITDSKPYEEDGITPLFYIMSSRTHTRMSDRLEFRYLQLGMIDPGKPVNELTPEETFAAYFRYAGNPDRADYIGELLEHGKEYLGMTEKVFDEVTKNDNLFSEKEQYYRWLSDMRTMVSEAEKNGRAEGEKAGEARGKLEGEKIGKIEGAQSKQRSIAEKMMSMGMDTAVIAEATGLTEEEIAAL
mgnify:FL=1